MLFLILIIYIEILMLLQAKLLNLQLNYISDLLILKEIQIKCLKWLFTEQFKNIPEVKKISKQKSVVFINRN